VSPTLHIRSPLTDSTNVRVRRTFFRSDLVRQWRDVFAIDIEPELAQVEQVRECVCLDTGLVFYLPAEAAGSARLYERLEKFDWYYMRDKWEHEEAMSDLARLERVLEIGCGPGWFVERLSQAGVDAVGIELSASAVRAARDRGCNVQGIALAEAARADAQAFDGACAFQVLEHTPDPLAFLHEMIACVKSGGLIVLSFPNADSFLRHFPMNLLDMPPHHMTHWPLSAVRSLERVLPVRIIRVVFEPLAEYHAAFFIESQVTRLPGRRLRMIAQRFLVPVLAPVLSHCGSMRSRITGHTTYVCLQRLRGK
jgi:SAM-dependent methyltransferase